MTPGGDPSAFLLSPLGLALSYAWVFVCLAAVQLTVRLILRFDLRETALAALLLTLGIIAIALVYWSATAPAAAGLGESAGPAHPLAVVERRLQWLPVAAVPLAVAIWTVGRVVLRLRPRAALVCTLAMLVLMLPWLPFL